MRVRGIVLAASVLLIGTLRAATVEVAGLTITGDDPIGVLTVRAWADRGVELWSTSWPASASAPDAGPATLWLVAADAEPIPAERFGSIVLPWNAETSETSVARALGRWWVERATLRPAAASPPWLADWLAVQLLARQLPGGEAVWLDRAGDVPWGLARVAASSPVTAVPSLPEQALAQHWLYGEWKRVSAQRDPSALDPETRWAAYFFERTGRSEGPFLSLAASARWLDAVGRINARVRGREARVWWSELPRAERARWAEVRRERHRQLRFGLQRLHPIYHRAGVALAADFDDGPASERLAERFFTAWNEAETTAREIGQLLEK